MYCFTFKHDFYKKKYIRYGIILYGKKAITNRYIVKYDMKSHYFVFITLGRQSSILNDMQAHYAC